ncbi:MAG: hypothetical protein HKN41_13120 [Ilumatobacter sp.]|nr:hypothetical protein [Ilumatobacter sp.]
MGGALMIAVMWLLDAIGAPIWIVIVPWLAPTVGLVVWAIVNGDPATLTDDADGSWAGYVVRWTLGGEGEAQPSVAPAPQTTAARRPAPIRVIVATLIGAPITWAYLLFGVAALVGLN